MWWGGLNQVSIPQGKFEFSSHPERWVQGRCLGERMPPGLKGWKERGRRHTGQPHSHAQWGLSQLLLVDTFWPQGYKEAGGGPEQMPEPIRGPRTCQGSGPGMRRGPVPGRILNGLPAYLHVLINHKMSPRGRIKLSISLLTSTSSPHRQGPGHFRCPLSSASGNTVSITVMAGAQEGREKEKLLGVGAK